MGAVKLNFTRTVRAVLPESLTINDFSVFEAIFTLKDDPLTEKTVDIAYGSLDNATALPAPYIRPSYSVELYAGTYNLVIVAYLDGGKTEPAAIYIHDTDIPVTDNGTEYIQVTLEHFNPANPQDGESYLGYFAWDIDTALSQPKGKAIVFNHNGNPVPSEITITPIATAPSVLPPAPQPDTGPILLSQGRWNSSDNWGSGSTNPGAPYKLYEGYYFVDIEISVWTHAGSIDYLDTYTSRHVIHIYRNMTTSLEFIFSCCGLTEDEQEEYDDGELDNDWNEGDYGDGLGNEKEGFPTSFVVFGPDSEALKKINAASDEAWIQIEFTNSHWISGISAIYTWAHKTGGNNTYQNGGMYVDFPKYNIDGGVQHKFFYINVGEMRANLQALQEGNPSEDIWDTDEEKIQSLAILTNGSYYQMESIFLHDPKPGDPDYPFDPGPPATWP